MHLRDHERPDAHDLYRRYSGRPSNDLAHEAKCAFAYDDDTETSRPANASRSEHRRPRRLRRSVRPRLLVIDDVGSLPYSCRHGDLLIDILNKCNRVNSTVLTPDKTFSEWGEVVPTSAESWRSSIASSTRQRASRHE